MKSIKTLCLLAAIAGLSYNPVSAQTQPAVTPTVTFKNVTNLPYPLTWTSSVTDGNNIYTVAGYKGGRGGYSSDVLKYSPETNNWTKIADMGGNKVQSATAYVPATGKIYIFGGIGGVSADIRTSQIFQGVQSVDIKTGEVKNLNVLNPMASTYGSAVEWGNKIYLFGGSRDGKHSINSVYEFNPLTLKFTQLADMPEYLQAAGTVVNGVIYTFGGYDAFLKHQGTNIYAYDIKANTWKTVGKLPEFMSANSVAASGNVIFVAGSYDDENLLGYFDTDNGKFTKLKSNMEPRRAASSAIVNNMLFIFGGSTRFKAFNVSTLETVQATNITPFLKNSTSR